VCSFPVARPTETNEGGKKKGAGARGKKMNLQKAPKSEKKGEKEEKGKFSEMEVKVKKLIGGGDQQETGSVKEKKFPKKKQRSISAAFTLPL